MAPWAKENIPLVNWPAETENFIDYWQARAKDDTKKDWLAAWRTWMRNAQKDLAGRGVTRRWQLSDNDQGRGGSELARRTAPEQTRRSTGALRMEQALAVAAELDAQFANGDPR
jgi:hypothetical protein